MAQNHYSRGFEQVLLERLKEKPQFIQTILGPRQVGKTSGTLNVIEKKLKASDSAYFSCEEGLHDQDWFIQNYQKALQSEKKILVFDEIQKLNDWSNLVKLVWDQQKRAKSKIHLVLLGSSSLQLSQGLGESLAGRFETIPVNHWSFEESKKAYGVTWEEYLAMGGYPGSYPLRKDSVRFQHYLMDTVFESVVGKDILRFSTIKKPALFRQTFALACQFPAQEISYNKLLGKLQEAGNVDQIKHYLELFSQAFLIRLLYKWSASPLSRTSSPKLLPRAPVFTSLFLRRQLTTEEKGRVFECIVGNKLCDYFSSVHFWREGHFEVDYIVDAGSTLYAVEVKTKSRKNSGLQAFKKKHPKTKICMVDFENYFEFEKDPVGFLKEYSV